MADEWVSAGATAVNKETGERIGKVDGKWVPIDSSAVNPQSGERRVKVTPKAGWWATAGEGLVQGATEAGSVVPLAIGGIRAGAGDTEAADKFFGYYDRLQKQAKESKPKGWQSTAQKVVGGLAGLVPGIAVGGGNVAPLAVSRATTGAAERVKGGMAPATAAALGMTQGAGEYTGMSLPLSFGKGAWAVPRAAGVQAAVAGTERLSEADILSLDPQQQKAAAEALKDIFPSMVVMAAMNFGAAGLVKLVQFGGKKAVDQVRKAVAAKPAAATPAVPESAPAAAPAVSVPKGFESVAGEMETPLPPGFAAPVAEPKAKPAVPETQEAKKARETAEWEAEMQAAGAGDLSSMDGMGERNAATAARPAPATAPAPVVNREAKMPPIIMEDATGIKGDLYGQHPLEGLTDFDRASLIAFSPSYKASELTPQQVVDAIQASGHTLEQAKAHGQDLEKEIVGKHNSLVKPDAAGKWTDESTAAVRGPIRIDPPRAAPAAAAPVPAPAAPAAPAHAQIDIDGKPYALDTPEKSAAYKSARQRYDELRRANKAIGAPTVALKRAFDSQVRDIVGAPAPTKPLPGMEATAEPPVPKYTGPNDFEIKEARKQGIVYHIKKALGLSEKEIREGIVEGDKISMDRVVEALSQGGGGYERLANAEIEGSGGWREIIGNELLDGEMAYPSRASLDIIEAPTRAERLGRIEAEAEKAHDGLVEAVEEGQGNAVELTQEWERKLTEAASAAQREGLNVTERTGMIGRLTAKAAASGGLLALAQAAKADDGSDTDTSDWLTVAAVATVVGGPIAWNQRAALKGLATNPMDFVRKMMQPVIETGAKRIVDQWRGYAARMGIAAVRASNLIEAENKEVTLAALSQNKTFNQYIKFIADQYTAAKYKNAANMSMRLNAAIDHWDLSDKSTRARLEAFRTNIDPAIHFPEFHYEAGMQGIEAGLRAGMKLKGRESGEVFAQMSVGAFESIARGKMIRDLKDMKLPNGQVAMYNQGGTGKMPPNYHDYKRIGDSWGGTLADLEGWRIHPDLVNDFKLSFNTYEPGNLARSLMALNFMAKRSKVSVSLFHGMSLAQAEINDVLGRVYAGQAPDLNGIGTALKALREGGAPMYGNMDGVMLLVGNGLRLDSPIEAALGRESTYGFLSTAQKMMDDVVPLSGTVTAGALRETDRAIQHFTWDYLQTGFKVMTALKQLESQVAKHPNKDMKLIAEEAAEYTNDIFGSLDWRRIGYQMKSRWGRNLAAEMFSGRGKFWMDMAMFAPDWFAATARSWIKALPKSKNGQIVWDDQSRMYGRYLLGGLTSYIAIGEAMNYAFSGHGMQDNKPTKKNPNYAEQAKAKMMIDFGDGRFIQLSKHFTDFPDVVLEPGKAFFNKMATLPATALQLATNKQYLGYEYAPPVSYSKAPAYASPQGALDVIKHLTRAMAPISGQQVFTGTGDFDQAQLERALYGFGGMPLRGLNAKEKAAMRKKENARKAAAK